MGVGSSEPNVDWDDGATMTVFDNDIGFGLGFVVVIGPLE